MVRAARAVRVPRGRHVVDAAVQRKIDRQVGRGAVVEGELGGGEGEGTALIEFFARGGGVVSISG